MSNKIRLDQYLAENHLCESREKAKAAIMAGQVYVNGQKICKAGELIHEQDQIEIRGGMEFVSRGGYKLKKAMEVFPITLSGSVCADIGASTGGFTDCMLQNGAKKVYAVDVGYGQLAWKLRCDDRVVNLERTNIRYVTEEQIPEKIDFASIDVAFISLRLVLPVVYGLLKEDGKCVCLIKPQFEAGREKVGKKGVVRDKNVHLEVVSFICEFASQLGFSLCGLDYSPIKGPEGNIEYLLLLSKSNSSPMISDETISAIVESSHAALDHS